MSIELKTREQIAMLREAGRIVAEVYEVLRPHVVPGVTTLDLDRMAEEYIRKRGAIPVYKGYVPDGGHSIPPFPGTICASVNDVICHGIPSQKIRLKEGDILGVDIGVKFKGWCGDSCYTYGVGNVDEVSQRLMDVTKRSLELAIQEARPGNQLGDIGFVIQRHVEAERLFGSARIHRARCGARIARDAAHRAAPRAAWQRAEVSDRAWCSRSSRW